MSLSTLPSILVPLVGLIIPLSSIIYFLIFVDQENIS